MTRSQITCVQCMAYLTVIVPILVDGMRIPREISGLGRPRHYYRMSYKGQTIDTHNAALATSQSAENIASSIYSNFYENVITRSDVEELDITILLDSSISLGRRNYENGKSFLSNLVGMLPIRDFASRIRMSMYSFSESAQLTQEFGFGDIAFRELVRRHINEAQYHNGSYTHLTNALYWIDAFITRTARPASKNVLIVATDGKSNDDNGINSSGLNGPIAQLSEEGVEVFVVALGSNLDLTRIAILASQPDSSHIFHLRNTNTTNAILRNLATTVIRNRS